MTILMVIVLSSWDSSYITHKQIASFETTVQCENAMDRLNTAYQTHKYLCVKEVK